MTPSAFQHSKYGTISGLFSCVLYINVLGETVLSFSKFREIQHFFSSLKNVFANRCDRKGRTEKKEQEMKFLKFKEAGKKL